MDIGAMVTIRRGKQSMAEFARSLGVTRQRVWQWEHNDHKPPALIRRKLGIRIRYEMKAVKKAGGTSTGRGAMSDNRTHEGQKAV